MTQERVVLLAIVHGEADKVAQRVSALEGEVMAVCRARDAAEEEIPNLASKAAAVE
jgi:hypothetical protein